MVGRTLIAMLSVLDANLALAVWLGYLPYARHSTGQDGSARTATDGRGQSLVPIRHRFSWHGRRQHTGHRARHILDNEPANSTARPCLAFPSTTTSLAT